MNTYITIHISKRKKIQLSIDEAQRLYMQLQSWLSPRNTTYCEEQPKADLSDIAHLLQPTTVKAYTPVIPPLPQHIQTTLDDFNIKH